MQRIPSRPLARAFTLVEIMVSTTIMGLVAVGILSGFITALKAYKYATFRVEINHDLRDLTNEMTDNGTYANYFLVFQDFSPTNGNNGTTLYSGINATSGTYTDSTHPRYNKSPFYDTISGVNYMANITDGTAGNFVVLVYKDKADDTKVARLVGYYKATDSSGNAALYKFDKTISPSVKVTTNSADTSGTLIWTLFPAMTTVFTNTQIIPDSRKQTLTAGTTSTILPMPDPTNSAKQLGMFYNFYNRSVIVNSKVQYSSNDGVTRTAVSTYNFTISPRG